MIPATITISPLKWRSAEGNPAANYDDENCLFSVFLVIDCKQWLSTAKTSRASARRGP